MLNVIGKGQNLIEIQKCFVKRQKKTFLENSKIQFEQALLFLLKITNIRG